MSAKSPNSDTVSVQAVADGLALLIEHTKKDLALKKEPPRLSHYRVIPENLQTAYDLIKSGATLVRATATKYALVGAIDTKDQGTLGMDLLKGCELIAASAHVFMPDPSGCSRALREYTQKAALSIFVATLKLVQAFHPTLVSKNNNNNNNNTSSRQTIAIASKDNNVGAQKTGAVWEACDHILNKMLPQGNRNAMRREIFTLTRECNDTMEEFDELVEMGPKEEENNGETNVEEEEDDEDDDPYAFGDEEDQYSELELPMAKACLGLLKNSRGNMKIALESCEALGKLEQEHSEDPQKYLEAILTVHGQSKKVGEGVTDLGSLLYPPLLGQSTDLKEGVLQQIGFIVEFQDYLLGLDIPLPETVTKLANTLKTSAENKQKEFLEALEKCQAAGEQ